MKSKHRHFQRPTYASPTYASISLVHKNINEKISLHTRDILTRKIKQPISFIPHEIIQNLMNELRSWPI